MSAKTYDKQSGKLIARIAENLPELSSDVMQGWIDNPKGLQKFLLGLNPPATPEDFAVWKTVKLGTHKDAAALRKAMIDEGMKIGSWGDDILGKPAFKMSSVEKDVDLVVRSVAELGFKKGATYVDICAKAKELGLELCPNEVGPQLCLQYKDQPKGEWLVIAMEAITDSGGVLGVFDVGRGDGDRWLGGDRGDPGCFWDADSRFVFVRRK